MSQTQLDIENASEPLLPVAMDPAAAPGPKTTNCCMIACCAPLAIKNGGGGGPDPKPTPPTDAAPARHHAVWAHVFKANVVLTVAAAVWFGGMAMEALANDSLTGEGRRRLMHQHYGDHSRHHANHAHHGKQGGFRKSMLILVLSGNPHLVYSVFCGVSSVSSTRSSRSFRCSPMSDVGCGMYSEAQRF